MSQDEQRTRVPPTLNDLGAALGRHLPRRLGQVRQLAKVVKTQGRGRRKR